MQRNPLLWILLGAFVLRLAAAFVLQHYLDARGRTFLIVGDAEGYWELGDRIAHGQPYQLYEPPRKVERMPGYPAFVAVALRISEFLGLTKNAYLVARILLAGVGTLTCALVALLGRDLFDARAGTIAAAIAAVAPPLIAFSVILLSETLFAAMLMLSLCCIARLVQAQSRGDSMLRQCGWAALSGLAIALAVYVRPSWLLAAPCLALLLVFNREGRRRFRQAATVAVLSVACTYAALLPWAYRNYEATGHWIFTTLWAGPSLYDGLNPNSNGQSDLRFFDREQLSLQMSEYEVDRHYREAAWQFVRDEPALATRLTLIKIARFWMPWPNAPQFHNWALTVVIAPYFVCLLLAALFAWFTGPRNFWGWTLSWGPILYFSAVHAVFLGSLRYRLPAEYPLCIASAVGFRQVWKRMPTVAKEP